MKSLLTEKGKKICLLLDPDKARGDALLNILKISEACRADFILAGGSLTFNNIDPLIDHIRENCSLPVILFPGNLLQLSHKADAILLLSLISGRNPELLIGNHVIAAPYLKDVKSKLIPVGYILISCGSKTSVEYISHTEAIPSDKPEIVVATAMAGEMLGLKLIYLEAGSGANSHVPVDIISSVRGNISVPIAVGGGIRDSEEIRKIYDAGADIIVLGNGCEKRPELLIDACKIRDEYL
jgi:putative glycerol-1-phosphate prenyltransferase